MEQDAHLRGQNQTDTSASDRLKKAIERNRAKQAKRSTQPSQAAAQNPPARPQRAQRPAAKAHGESQESLMNRLKAARAAGQQASSMQSPPDLPGGLSSGRPAQVRTASNPARPTANARVNRSVNETAEMSLTEKLKLARKAKVDNFEEEEEERSWGLPGMKKKRRATSQDVEVPTATRKTVAKQDSVEFTTALRKSPRKAPAAVGYSTAKRKVKTKSKSKSLQNNAINYLVKGAWGFCFFLLLRLIFSEGGVVDYYASQSLMNDKLLEYQSIQDDNKNLAIEIEKIKLNKSYQKKLVRDNLGFIAKDEYLILFPKSKKMSSI